MALVFIDGSVGTTGLRLYDRLKDRKDVEILHIPEEYRKDISARADYLNRADICFLCLPDAASIEAAGLIDNPNTVLIDTSTAHRVNDEWIYGFPELHGQRDKIRSSKRVANPGCHASGFISLVAPLVETGVISPDVKLSAFSITGYSGGGKKMIAEYESTDMDSLYEAPRMYGITQKHKHLPEMKKICKLNNNPIFSPIVAAYYSGMEVTVPLFAEDIRCSISELATIYQEYYKDGLVHFKENADENGFMSACSLAGRDDMQISVAGNDERILLVSRFDNLGKGASGSAIQNMNIILGLNEDTGLNV